MESILIIIKNLVSYLIISEIVFFNHFLHEKCNTHKIKTISIFIKFYC
jgi:hypothetical protein